MVHVRFSPDDVGGQVVVMVHHTRIEKRIYRFLPRQIEHGKPIGSFVQEFLVGMVDYEQGDRAHVHDSIHGSFCLWARGSLCVNSIR